MADEKDPFEDIKKEIQTRFTLLPPELQSAITSSDYQTKLFEISKKHKMTYEQLGVLEMETTMVLLGMTKPDDFRDEVQVELKMNDPEVEALVKDISDVVFVPLRESLKKVYEVKAQTEAPRGKTANEEDAGVKTLAGGDKNVLASAGISIEETKPTVASTTIGSRAEAMQGIENPSKNEPIVLNPIAPKTPTPEMKIPVAPQMTQNMPRSPINVPASTGNIVADKLGGISASTKKESEFIIQNPTAKTPTAPPVAPKLSGDPYKEPL